MDYDSGDVLCEGVESIGLRFCDVFVTNTVHCHPPGNRSSKPEEVRNCKPWLEAEISLIQPGIVIALGSDAINWFRYRIYNNFTVINMYHPSYVLRSRNEALKERWIQEWQQILDIQAEGIPF